jgi:hypothetical protein
MVKGRLLRVSDGGGPDRPQVRDAGPFDTRGRGLAIVQAIYPSHGSQARWQRHRDVHDGLDRAALTAGRGPPGRCALAESKNRAEPPGDPWVKAGHRLCLIGDSGTETSLG